jgi:hypothetical protein
MRRTTFDRGAIMHFAGFHHLSPALDERGAPAFSAQAGDGRARCGWAAFFAAMAARGLALAFDDDDASAARFVPAGQSKDEGEHATLASAIGHAKRFLRALRGGGAPGPPPGE